MKSKFFSHKLKLFVLSILIIMCSQLLLRMPINTNFNPLLVILIAISGLYFFLVDLSDSESLAKNALITILLFGTVISLAKPVQFGLDEETHLRNTLRLSDGFIIQFEKENIPDYSSVYNHDILRSPDTYTDNTYWLNVEHQDSQFSGKIIGLNNIVYLPSALGWNLGKLISTKIFISYYLGRIANIIVFGLLIYLAIRWSRVYKEIVYLFGTFPAILYICAGFHYDYLYYAASLMLAALLTNILNQDSPLIDKQVIAYLSLTFLFTFAKFPYILLGALICLLPNRYYQSMKQRLRTCFYFSLQFILSFVYYINGSIIRRITGGVVESIPSETSLGYFLTHPFPAIRTFFISTLSGSLNSFARALEYTIIESEVLQSISLILFLFLIFLLSLKLKIKVSNMTKILIFTFFVGITLLIIYAISGDVRVYRPGDIWIGGVQGRYYYLMLLFLPIILSPFLREMLMKDDYVIDPDNNVAKIMQHSIALLNILTIAIAIFTQTPHKL
ncbi:TPA: DUF2142 domain-containing protein [Streptococcus suis]|uniref:DUF2142 domain-containing protein n=1 Tax=Streptococcus suis TaxID=1307 RepID=UPI002B1521BE|nr:DUF2142 domain-containing protein [Streptococcus suis]